MDNLVVAVTDCYETTSFKKGNSGSSEIM